MKVRQLFMGLLLPSIILVLLCGCEPVPEVPTHAPENDMPAIEIYENALSKLKDFSISVEAAKYIQTATQTLTEQYRGTYHFQDYGTECAAFYAEETLDYGVTDVAITRCFSSGTAYLSIGQGNFSAPESFHSYLTALIPVVIPTGKDFSVFQGRQIGGRTLIGLTEPADLSSIGLTKTAKAHIISATVMLSPDGLIDQISCTIAYTTASAKVLWIISAKPVGTPQDITVPADLSTYTNIQNILSPILLERCSGLLSGTQSIFSDITSTIVSEADGLTRSQSTQMVYDSTDGALNAVIDTHVSVTDKTRQGDTTSHRQTESFRNGVYTVAADHNTTQDPSVTEELMRNYCANQLVNILPLPSHIAGGTVSVSADQTTVIFYPTESLTKLVGSNISQILYQDPALLETFQIEGNAAEATIHLILDTGTGLPVSASISYTAKYSTDQFSYGLTSSTAQTYIFS